MSDNLTTEATRLVHYNIRDTAVPIELQLGNEYHEIANCNILNFNFETERKVFAFSSLSSKFK